MMVAWKANKTMLRVNKELFQWEKNRYIYVDQNEEKPILSCVQFYNKKSESSFESPIEDGKAAIPNFLLKENLPIVALGCIKVQNEAQVICRKEFRVLQRVKPEFYIDEDVYKDVVYDGGVEI